MRGKKERNSLVVLTAFAFVAFFFRAVSSPRLFPAVDEHAIPISAQGFRFTHFLWTGGVLVFVFAVAPLNQVHNGFTGSTDSILA